MVDPVRAAQMTVGDGDLARLSARFGLSGLEQLGGFENVLLRSAGAPARIVRLTHTSRRSLQDVEAEVAFMEHLAVAGVPVVAPVPSVLGEFACEFVLDDGSTTVAYCMTEAPGRIKDPHEWSGEEIAALGDLLGRAHIAAASFDPSAGPRRPPWTDPKFDPGTALVDDQEIVASWRATRLHATRHPAGATTLLIHQDAHFWNLHVEDPLRLTLFDFDDCAYGTPEHDVAIVLFYWLFVEWPDPVGAARRFLGHLLDGYSRHADLAADWLEGVDRILKVREADIYLLLALEHDPDAHARRWMKGRRGRLLDGVPLLGRPLVEFM